MLRFRLSNKNERQQFEHAAGPLEFGRSPTPDGATRCVVQDPCVSKTHLRVQELPEGRLQVENLSTKYPVYLPDNRTLAPGAQCELGLPIRLAIGETVLAIDFVAAVPLRREMLETIAPPVHAHHLPEPEQQSPHLDQAPTLERLTQWFESVIAVQRAAAGSSEFYEQTARALVDLVGLDRGLILLRQGKTWHVAAHAAREERNAGREFSRTILHYVVAERRTFYQASTAAIQIENLAGVEAIVAAPICDADEQVVGVVYGSRTRAKHNGDRSIGALEAQVVQLLASTVGVGLARQTQGAEAERLRQAKDAAAEADQAKDRLLTTLSQELRTALDTILRSNAVLQQEAQARGQDSFLPDLQQIHVAANHLLQLVKDLAPVSSPDTNPPAGSHDGERGTSVP